MSSMIEKLNVPRQQSAGKPLNQLLRENQEQRAAEAKQAKGDLQTARDFRMQPTLSAALGLNKAQRENEKEAGGDGRGKGELSRPTHASFYQPMPVGGIAPPKADERSQAIEAAERVRRRGMGRSI